MRTLSVALLLLASAASAADPAAYWVFLGTGTSKDGSKGIYRCRLDTATGQLGTVELAALAANPTFLAIHPDGKHLVAVAELSGTGAKGGAVALFKLDGKTGKLAKVNEQPSGGQGPCHVSLDATGKVALVSHYNSGSVAAMPVAADGLKPVSTLQQHAGSRADPKRQDKPHTHSALMLPGNKVAAVADLGLDQIKLYRLDPAAGTLTPNDPPAAALAPGAGPRHMAVHPDGKRLFCINELNGTLTAFDLDGPAGKLTARQTVPTLPDGWRGANTTAEVVVHPNGKFVYGSNRGHDSIAIFALDDAGTLTPKGHATQGVKTPRNFAIDPTGRWLLVANQGSDSVVVFKLDPATGALTPTDVKASVGRPMCVRFVKVG